MIPPEDRVRDVALGAHVRRLRVGQGLSQEKLAEAIGVTFQQLQKYEKGVNRISCSKLLRIADVLGIPASEILATIEGQVPLKPDPVFFDHASRELAASFNRLPPTTRRAIVTLVRSMEPAPAAEPASTPEPMEQANV
ncbi:hypothetical protein ATO13_22341 [Stappia sp. 22II-S9-Z10]|nr:hypothetical protein ATO13_22341 [Stappia sp. 22II-S9-Z10]